MDAVAELDIKQRLAKLSVSERRSISAYLLRLKHASQEGREEMSRLMAEMDAGQKTRLSDLKGDMADA
jgi:hypothetical protein